MKRSFLLAAVFCGAVTTGHSQQFFPNVRVDDGVIQARVHAPGETPAETQRLDKLVHLAEVADQGRLSYMVGGLKAATQTERAENCAKMMTFVAKSFQHVEGVNEAPMRDAAALHKTCLTPGEWAITDWHMTCIQPVVVGPETVLLYVRYEMDQRNIEAETGSSNDPDHRDGHVVRMAIRTLGYDAAHDRALLLTHGAFNTPQASLQSAKDCHPLPAPNLQPAG